MNQRTLPFYTYKYMSSLEQQMGEFIRTFILQLTF